MRHCYLIAVSAIVASCSTVDKFGPKKVFEVKSFHTGSLYEQESNLSGSPYEREGIEYYVTKGNDQHCFDSNPDNREIITVEAKYIQYAIDHFYKRVVHVDINVRRYAIQYPKVEVTTTESVEGELETASCTFKPFGGIFGYDTMTGYVSFKLAK